MHYKKGKKSGAVLLALCMAILTGCSGTAQTTSEMPETEVVPEEKAEFRITDEANAEIKLPNQPTASFWMPDELLQWKPEADENLAFNISTIPLAERVAKDTLEPVNDSQSKDMNVVAISIMNASTSGNPSQGTNKFAANTFTYWQYIDKLVYWGGSSAEGLIVPPSADVINAAHKNGVPVLGTVFFPQAAHGGKLEWLDQFLNKAEDGTFPMAEQLIKVAGTYGFEGWFINQETEGDEASALTADHAVLMQEFIKYLKAKAPELEIMWYDSMTAEGKMDWQNALTDQNAMFLQDSGGQPVADSMFLNFWWTTDKLADQELLKTSSEKAAELGLDSKQLYAGIDVQADGILTPVKWNLLEKAKGDYYTSLGLYCPSWTYFSATDINDYEVRDKAFWVNKSGNPAVSGFADSGWKGISTFAVEQTVIRQYPFETDFSVGNGYSFFIDGEKVSLMDWNDRGISGIMPTYRWMMEHEGKNALSASIDFANAWHAGNSIKFRGDLEAAKKSLIHLFAADLKLEENTIFTTMLKATSPVAADLVLRFSDGTEAEVTSDATAGEDWTKVTYDVTAHTGKTVKRISLRVSSADGADGADIYLGKLAIRQDGEAAASVIEGLIAETPQFDDDQMFAGVRLLWEDAGTDTAYYEIFRTHEDGTRTFLGETISKAFFVNVLPREDKVLETKFEVIGVNKNGERGEAARTTITWPDNSLPKAKFKASTTLATPGEEITFTSLSSANTEELSWEFPGADQTTSTETDPVVTYGKEGVYPVMLTARNEAGEERSEVNGYIIINAKAADMTNLSQGKECEATSFVNNNEAPPFAVDGKTETKWCAVGAPPHAITIDLGDKVTVSRVDIAHAQAGGESPDMNSLSYTLEVSNDNTNFIEVAAITKNADGNTQDAFAPINARYVRLTLKKPTQGSDTAARIYEIQVFGLQEVLQDAVEIP